jgi:uncharacterized protein (TIGR00369 family)
MENLANMDTCALADRICRWMKQVGREHPRAFGCNLPCELVSCDAQKREVVFKFRTVPEMGNPWGVTHGGMLAVMLDWSMGVTGRAVLDYNHTPTVDMQIQYLRPVPLDGELYIRASVRKSGKKIAFLTATAWTEDEEDPTTLATGVYYLREQHLKINERNISPSE